jgi:hypothetical protein
MHTHVTNLTGRNGGKIIAGTDATTPASGCTYFQAILVINDAVISAITFSSRMSGSGLTGITITAGTIFYGEISSITLASGVVIAYHGDCVN